MQLRIPTLALRLYATIAPTSTPFPTSTPSMSTSSIPESVIEPRMNVLGSALLPVPVGDGPKTGFFRENMCDASQLDPASHTVAAVLGKDFLEYSASRGNDLRPLFPALKKDENAKCLWCICASRWTEALFASKTHKLGEAIVPKVLLESTHEQALKYAPRSEYERFAIGGNGDGLDGTPGGSGGKAAVRPGR